MLRYPSRALAHHAAVRGTVSPTLLTSSRLYTDRLLICATSAGATGATTIGLFHLLVTPVTAPIAAATVATATACGAAAIIDGGSEGGTSFSAVCGIFVGAMGGYYAKSQKEPWRK